MRYLNKRDKIIFFIILGVIIIGIYYYINTKDKNILTAQEENLEVQENKVESVENENNEEKIKVHVSGAVNKEGVVELEINSRMADAIDKAGGIKKNACMDEINLAYKLEDGMKVYIPTIDEKKEAEQSNETGTKNNEYVTMGGGTNNKNENKSQESTKININTCTQTELETLPGIGPSTALKIIQYRNEKGKFKSIEEIKEVSGIGESKFNQIKDLIKV